MVICGRDGRMLAARVEKNEIQDEKKGESTLDRKAPYKPCANRDHVALSFCLTDRHSLPLPDVLASRGTF
jgi:hypothetical protein